MNNFKRRQFLKWGSGLLAGIAIGQVSCNNEGDKGAQSADSSATMPEGSASGVPLAAFGLQLYTLREDFPKDPKGVLKQIADMGYNQVEGFEGGKGLFWGMTNTEFKKYLDEIGLTMVSSHCDTSKDFEKKAAEAAAIGMKYLIYPYEGHDKKLDDYRKMADDFNSKGEICRKNGIRFAFHNHDFSFRQIDGKYPQDVMMENTDPSLVDYEMDIYWVVTAGEDPEQWMKKYPNRFTLCHVKDRSKTPVEDNGKNSVNLGTGMIDFPKVLKTGKENGLQYYIVEQEFYPGGTALEAARANATYMKALTV